MLEKENIQRQKILKINDDWSLSVAAGRAMDADMDCTVHEDEGHNVHDFSLHINWAGTSLHFSLQPTLPAWSYWVRILSCLENRQQQAITPQPYYSFESTPTCFKAGSISFINMPAVCDHCWAILMDNTCTREVFTLSRSAVPAPFQCSFTWLDLVGPQQSPESMSLCSWVDTCK